MVRYIPILLEVALMLYALVDCIQTSDRRIRTLPKLAWIVIVVVLPFVGPLAWLFAGRPPREDSRGAWPLRPSAGPERPRPLAPDDDPDFLAKLKKSASEDRDLLKKWEDDLRRREERLRSDDPDDPDGPAPRR